MDTSKVQCRVAREGDMAAAQQLVDENYVQRGYGSDHSIPAGAHTFVAEVDGSVVATVSLVLEGDKAWLVRLASSARSVDVLAGLFYLAYAHGTAIGGASELYIDVRPGHEIGLPFQMRDHTGARSRPQSRLGSEVVITVKSGGARERIGPSTLKNRHRKGMQ